MRMRPVPPAAAVTVAVVAEEPRRRAPASGAGGLALLARSLPTAIELGFGSLILSRLGGLVVLRTRLTERLGIELPFVLAPMGPYANGELAAAVSNAGGLGTIGAWPTMGVDEAHVRREIGVIRDRTERPFGAGFATHHIATGRACFDAVLEEGVPVVLLSFDDPTPWVPMIHEAGATVICQVQSHEAARQAVEAGADVICVQGNEAGGHTGTQNLLPALVRALDSFDGIPIIAAAAGIAWRHRRTPLTDRWRGRTAELLDDPRRSRRRRSTSPTSRDRASPSRTARVPVRWRRRCRQQRSCSRCWKTRSCA